MNDRTFKAADAARLENPERLLAMPPDEAAREIGLTEGMTVADIGAGSGFFAVPFAQLVARVIAVDIQDEMLALIAEKQRAGAPANIALVRGSAEATTLDAASCDVAFLANVWHEVDSRPAALQEAGRILKPGGRIAILDWRADLDSPPGPRRDHRIPEAQAAQELEAAGWSIIRRGHFGLSSYLLVATRG